MLRFRIRGPSAGVFSDPDFIPHGPPADGGYPADSALHQMSDDGGPVGPDPARWADPEWRDNPGEWDTFVDGESQELVVTACP